MSYIFVIYYTILISKKDLFLHNFIRNTIFKKMLRLSLISTYVYTQKALKAHIRYKQARAPHIQHCLHKNAAFQILVRKPILYTYDTQLRRRRPSSVLY